ncbi:hypothetical protein EI94DRAFT_1770519 [Lactarius quietus]|nr:hypothetical protein EI94DRAFT_1770519 [Lactarius quietus]
MCAFDWMGSLLIESDAVEARKSPSICNLWQSTIPTQPGRGSPRVRLEGSSDDPSSSSGASSPPSSSSSSSGDDPDGSDPPASPPPDSAPASPSTSISRQSVPENYPQVLALPIARRPLFPGFYKAVVIRNPQVVAAVKEMMKRDEQADSDVITDVNSVHPVGVFAQITSVFAATGVTGKEDEKEEGLTAVLYPHRRIKIADLVKAGGSQPSTAQVEPVEPLVLPSQEQLPTPPPSPEAAELSCLCTSFLQDYDVSIVNITNLFTQPYNKDDQYIRAFMSEIVSVFKDIAQLNPLFRDQITNFSINQVASNVFDEPDKLADFAAAVSTGEVGELQDVLESLVVEDRLRKALLVLKKELINAQLQSKLSRDVDSKIAKRQREYYLMEQLKGIKKELGMESDGKDKLIEKLKTRAAQLAMPEPVKRLMHLEPAASEANVTRNYLDWLTQIPWGQHSPENYSIAHAKRVLDEDHYGLKDVKERILEFLAVGKLRGSVEGKIICLAGPPGVGKTSIGKSIARALGGSSSGFPWSALPGKIIQALKRVGTENPLVLIDEVDKVGRGINGDPASALLEMLDPEQNNAFLDHYMDVPVDLSRVLFVCTANVLDTIPAPLLDRMEVIEVSGYVSEEKSMIAERYLGPQAKEASGLKDADVMLDPASVDVLIKYYCRESGVRNLKKHIDKIYRKASLKIVEDLGEDAFPEAEAQPTAASAADQTVPTQDPPKITTEKRKPFKVPDSVHILITPENLKDYVGPPVYQKDRMYVRAPPAGVSTGLGYLGNGSGAVMPIEATMMPGKGGLQLTGKLGEVIRESAQIALSWTKAHAHASAVGKEGPSAGTALLSAFVSLFTKTPINPDIAMTGEISLVGQVLPVGGLKEKILAAHRAGNVPDSVKTGIRFVYVEDVKEVLAEVFGGTPLAERLRETLPP